MNLLVNNYFQEKCELPDKITGLVIVHGRALRLLCPWYLIIFFGK